MAQYKVALRGGFADRNKIKEENTAIQVLSFDQRTRAALVNMTDIIIHSYFADLDISHISSRHVDTQDFLKHLLADVYSHVVKWSLAIPYNNVWSIIKDTLLTDDYASVLTLIEYITQTVQVESYRKVFYKGKAYTAEQAYNLVFQQEYVGYRLIKGQALPITDETEIEAIQESTGSKHAEVRQHLDKALGFLSDRQTPDYANSIKESISAVERMCSIIVGKATSLGDALNNLQKKGVSIHPQLRSAFEKLFAYTNGASGVRHAGDLGGKDSTFEEAKFMLVSCCAFVNYLTGLMAKQK